MKTAKLASLSLAVALAAPLTAQASNQIIQNWFLDPDGGGAAAPSLINTNLSTNGDAWVTLTPTGPGTSTFEEWGVFTIPNHDGGTPFFGFGGELTATLYATGTATAGSGATFTGGMMTLYSDPTPDFTLASADPLENYGANGGDSVKIAEFMITGGSISAINLDFTPVNNTDVVVTADATFLAPGYFFLPDGTTDMIEMLPGGSLYSGDPILFGFATTNASTNPNPNANFFGEVVGELAGSAIAAADFNDPAKLNFVVSNGGQLKLATVPEPASVGLIGLGLLALGMGRRRKQKA